MNTLMRALSAEVLKTKRTLTLWLVILAPLAIAFLEFVMDMQRGVRALRPNTDAWIGLTQNSLILWALLMLPLFVTLETGLLKPSPGEENLRSDFPAPTVSYRLNLERAPSVPVDKCALRLLIFHC